ncbi:glyoxylase-like metal-dependent hydrolase (beta-lactamase superfamily II) [Prauserella shujinwangii]|uniref:Glyoxylase-like metal-dependent hydrolase (Beta-lactamase superfamily II) n=1 Tax=Prauserella shujinwangii TaxID=1453103 RepID=A0A2T0LRM4_9PSEU|nr:MBL fold metallo-hydrolase [Prauserella shujinwangii]PRX46138.1 glyoxylase-like metal-dependent hydrolase (beta-lactamase superfamily II) [Prauserella shujinwangii]
MLVVGFPAGAFQANCYLLAAGAGGGCMVVDPGEGAEEPLAEALREHRLTPAAVLATHGHLDHVYSAAAVADAHGLPLHIRPEDRVLLADPLRGLGAELAAALGPVRLAEPAEIADLGEEPVEHAELVITPLHTPGHTPGSAVFRLDSAEGGTLALTGDTLFAGSVGRTDLPGGDAAALAGSLELLLRTLPGDTVVLPGHGPTTTVAREKATNPFLREDQRTS